MTYNQVNDDSYFNDLSRQPQLEHQDSTSPSDQNGMNAAGEETGAAKPKRIACVICRKRKLKCDGNKPKCATCARLGHNCAYDEVRRKSGPKRGYVKDLEARLAQVEGKLKSQYNKKPKSVNESEQHGVQENNFATGEPMGMQSGMQQSMPSASYDSMPTNEPIMLPMTDIGPEMIPGPEFVSQIDLNLDQTFSWEMIGLGLEEPMPMQEAVDELTQVFFDIVHPSLPMIHKYRYYASMNLAPDRRPPICLRYIMWCHAASITEKYMHHQDIFYRRARKYIELDEMKSQGEAIISLAHAQTWVLVCAYEFKMMYFPRAWMSVGRAARLVTMMGLNRVDGPGLDVKQALPPAKDSTELEERRRTFWMAYCVDRYASVGTGWPMSIDERDIKSCLPVSEEAYESGMACKAPTLEEAMRPQDAARLSPLAGVVLVTHFFGLNLNHLHRPEPDQQEDDMNGPFWKRHRAMDNDLLKTALQLPSSLRLPLGVRNPNIVFLNFALHSSTICLHQAAISQAEKSQLPKAIIEQSRTRCILAAAEIASVMRLTSHLDVAGMNPFMAFCLYVAARVFVQYLKKTPNDQEIRQSLEFLLAAMQAIQRKNPLTESFLTQLKMDIEGNGLDVSFHYSASQYSEESVSALHQYSTTRQIMSQLHELQLIQSQASTRMPADYGISKYQCASIFHIAETSEESQSPADHQPQGDTRIPYRNARKESPTIRTEDPRQQTNTYRLPGDHTAREMPNSQFYSTAGLNTFTDRDKINAINIANSRRLDAEMTDQSANSRGLTPPSSNGYNHSSSNTSYSTPQPHDDDPNVSGISGGSFVVTGFPPQSQNVSAQPQEDPFMIPAGWGMGPGQNPGGLTGMTPDGGWEKLMDSMSWETGRTG